MMIHLRCHPISAAGNKFQFFFFAAFFFFLQLFFFCSFFFFFFFFFCSCFFIKKMPGKTGFNNKISVHAAEMYMLSTITKILSEIITLFRDFPQLWKIGVLGTLISII